MANLLLILLECGEMTCLGNNVSIRIYKKFPYELGK